MNDLLSKTFTSCSFSADSYVDLKMDVEMADANAESNSNKSLALFFQDVAVIKADMDKIRKILSALLASNAESKTLRDASTIKALRNRMDRDVEEVLRISKMIKGRLEELDQSNIRSWKMPGCERGSTTDRTRMSMTSSLRKTLKDLMEEFQDLRHKFMSEYRDTIQRRYFTVTGTHADEHVIDEMIDTGASEAFLQKAIQEQGRGHIMDTIMEIQERHEAVKEIEKNLMELHQIFLDMAVLVEAQGEMLNNIEAAVQGASSFVKRGTADLHTAKELQRNSRKWKCIAIIVLLVVILILVVPILLKILPSFNKSKG